MPSRAIFLASISKKNLFHHIIISGLSLFAALKQFLPTQPVMFSANMVYFSCSHCLIAFSKSSCERGLAVESIYRLPGLLFTVLSKFSSLGTTEILRVL